MNETGGHYAATAWRLVLLFMLQPKVARCLHTVKHIKSLQDNKCEATIILAINYKLSAQVSWDLHNF
jgi:hypothetical protein